MTRWLPIEVEEQYVLDYLYNKTIYPTSLPVTPEDLAIELAVAREALQFAVQQSGDSFTSEMRRSKTPGTSALVLSHSGKWQRHSQSPQPWAKLDGHPRRAATHRLHQNYPRPERSHISNGRRGRSQPLPGRPGIACQIRSPAWQM